MGICLQFVSSKYFFHLLSKERQEQYHDIYTQTQINKKDIKNGIFVLGSGISSDEYRTTGIM